MDKGGLKISKRRKIVSCLYCFDFNSAQILKPNGGIEMDFVIPEKMTEEGNADNECPFSIGHLS